MEVVVDRDRPGHNWSSGRGARCGFTLALIVVSMYGNALDAVIAGAGRLMTLIVVFAVVGWPGLMRFVRSLLPSWPMGCATLSTR